MSSKMNSDSTCSGAPGEDIPRGRRIRKASAAGRFYPASPEKLVGMVADLLDGMPEAPEASGKIIGLLVPHAGLVFSGSVAARAYALLPGKMKTDRVVLLGSSHCPFFSGVSVGGYDALATPMGDVPVDLACCNTLQQCSELFRGPYHVHDDEHALEVQLPFVQHVLPGIPVVPLLCGILSPQEIGQAASVLRDHIDGDRTVWIVSSDFTHHGEDFGYVPFVRDVFARIRELDSGAMAHIETLDWEGLLAYVADTGATLCGATGIALFLAMLRTTGNEVTCEMLEHALSGEMLHDAKHSVSYLSAAFRQKQNTEQGTEDGFLREVSPDDCQELLHLAREAIRKKLHGNSDRLPPDSTTRDQGSALLSSRYACFVTLYVGENMRGCMGDVAAQTSLSTAVQEHARQAAFMDSRFHPLSAAELPECRIEISILSSCRPIQDPGDIRIGTHGVSLKKKDHQAVLLPNVAVEHDWDGFETLKRLSLKAGLPVYGWRRAEISVFEVVTVRG